MTLIRTSYSSGYPFEDTYGYARAVRAGNQVFVSGTTARGHHLDGDAYTQMTAAIATVAAALVRPVRNCVTSYGPLSMFSIWQMSTKSRAHEETFGASRPASTLVQVAALTPASARVEIEVTAVIHD